MSRIENEIKFLFRSSKYFLGSEKDTHLHNPDLNWSILPAELKPVKLKKKSSKDVKPNLSAKKSKLDIEKRLKQLESKEQTGKDEESDKEEKEESDEDDEDKNVSGEISGEEDPDEEMDDGTDYANNYFDNGETYEDGEDDALEDGDVF